MTELTPEAAAQLAYAGRLTPAQARVIGRQAVACVQKGKRSMGPPGFINPIALLADCFDVLAAEEETQ